MKMLLNLIASSFILLLSSFQANSVFLTGDLLEQWLGAPCSSVTKLFLSDKSIEAIDPAAFQACTSLIELDLSKNLITKLEPDTFKPLTKLEKLVLCDNQIQAVDSSSFRGLCSLKWLNLN
jgi:Leucine-rich repeat (LRR) protein